MKRILILILVMVNTIIFGSNAGLRSMRDSIGNTGIDIRHNLNGSASFYGGRLHGSMRADGGRFNQWEMSAAHKTLPFGTIVKVTNLDNGRSVNVVINDRGPYIKGRVLDLSRGAFRVIEDERKGVLKNINIEIVELGLGQRIKNNIVRKVVTKRRWRKRRR